MMKLFLLAVFVYVILAFAMAILAGHFMQAGRGRDEEP